MRVIIYIARILTVIAFIASVFFTFEWQTATAIVVFTALVTAQVLFLSKRFRVNRGGLPTQIPTQNFAINKEKQQPAPPAPIEEEKEEEGEEAGSASINSEIFSKFQQSLSQSQQKEPVKTKEQQAEDVVLSISAAIKKQQKAMEQAEQGEPTKNQTKTAQPKNQGYNPYRAAAKKEPTPPKKESPPTAKPKVEEPPKNLKSNKLDQGFDDMAADSIASLFDDIDDPLDSRNEKVKKVAPKGIIEKDLTEVQQKISGTTPPPITANEILTSEDFKPDVEESKKENNLVTTTAKKSFQEGNHEEVIKIVQQWLQTEATQEASDEQRKELLQMKGKSEFELKKYHESSQTWQIYFKRFFRSRDLNSLKELEKLIEQFVQAKQQKHALHFLFFALSEYRQSNSYPEMDKTYHEIEEVYTQQGDLPRLTQTLQNHLGLKRIIKDYEGQLELLDHLGKLLYDQGDAKGSKRCYEQSIVIKQQMKGKI